MISCVRRLQFCMGHRVLNHEGKCSNMHGHNFVVFLHARTPALDDVGRVIDFGVVKEKFGGWIDEYWDHGFVFWEDDEEVKKALEACPGKKFPLPYNPTAENLASFLLEVVGPEVLKGSNIELFRVVVWETENCYASADFEESPF